MASHKQPRAFIEISDFRVEVYLGWGSTERKVTQSVRFDLTVKLMAMPKACTSDHLEDTICYATLCEQVARIAQKKSYRLIEHLSGEVVLGLKDLIGDHLLELRVTKVTPPIVNLHGGATFVYQEDSI